MSVPGTVGQTVATAAATYHQGSHHTNSVLIVAVPLQIFVSQRLVMSVPGTWVRQYILLPVRTIRDHITPALCLSNAASLSDDLRLFHSSDRHARGQTVCQVKHDCCLGDPSLQQKSGTVARIHIFVSITAGRRVPRVLPRPRFLSGHTLSSRRRCEKETRTTHQRLKS